MFPQARDASRQSFARAKMPPLLPALEDREFAGICARLDNLATNPPQTLLFEGGSEGQRLQAGLYWAMLANCPQTQAARLAGKAPSPCMECPTCRQINANEFLDLRIYDGRISNTQDEEKPGPVRALRMENMRELKTALSASPHGQGKRVVLLQGMTITREEALNSLLKILEEPSPFTLFVLLVSQREQILPTLVSRSFCVTLPWTDCNSPSSCDLLADFSQFLATGTGFFERIATKGALDAIAGSQLLLECQKALARAAAGYGKTDNPLDVPFARIAESQEKIVQLSRWITEAQGMMLATVNPPRILEAFGAKLFLLLRRQ